MTNKPKKKKEKIYQELQNNKWKKDYKKKSKGKK